MSCHKLKLNPLPFIQTYKRSSLSLYTKSTGLRMNPFLFAKSTSEFPHPLVILETTMIIDEEL